MAILAIGGADRLLLHRISGVVMAAQPVGTPPGAPQFERALGFGGYSSAQRRGNDRAQAGEFAAARLSAGEAASGGGFRWLERSDRGDSCWLPAQFAGADGNETSVAGESSRPE